MPTDHHRITPGWQYVAMYHDQDGDHLIGTAHLTPTGAHEAIQAHAAPNKVCALRDAVPTTGNARHDQIIIDLRGAAPDAVNCYSIHALTLPQQLQLTATRAA